MKQRKQRGFVELDYSKACRIEEAAKQLHAKGQTYYAARLMAMNGFTLSAALWHLLGRV